MSAPDDATLVEETRSGSHGAFGHLVARHEKAMMAIARSFFASEPDVEDAVQEAFVKAFYQLDRLKAGGSFASWLTRITLNTCIDTLRTRTDKVSLSDFASTARLRPRLGQQQLTPATLATKGEMSDLVKAALGHLPEDQRVVLMLRFSEDMTYQRIGEYLGVPATTVQGRLHRARRAMRSILKALGPA